MNPITTRLQAPPRQRARVAATAADRLRPCSMHVECKIEFPATAWKRQCVSAKGKVTKGRAATAFCRDYCTLQVLWKGAFTKETQSHRKKFGQSSCQLPQTLALFLSCLSIWVSLCRVTLWCNRHALRSPHALVMTLRLNPVAAGLHVAPAPPMILGGVQKQPGAFLRCANAQSGELLGREQFRCAPCD